MLGKNDFRKELGKGICIVPFRENNLKENSYNLTIGQNAWSMESGKVVKRNGKFDKATSNDKKELTRTINKGQSAIIEEGKNRYLVLLPRATTIVETSEVVGVDCRIGGTIHSKVGVVAQGIGDTSTMLGPCFCGHLMISLHNVTDSVISLSVGDTFISLIFYYLNTPNADVKNSNMSGHVDKLSELGIQINKTTREFLLEDWKQNIDDIREKLIKSESFLNYQKKEKEKKYENITKLISLKNTILLSIIILFFVVAYIFMYRMDAGGTDTKWMDRYWTIVSTCIIVPLVSKLIGFFDK